MKSFKETSPVAAEGFGLAATAGYVNVVMLGFYTVKIASPGSGLPAVQAPVSHMTGAFSRLGIDLAKGVSDDLLPVGSIVVGFFLGALVSGLAVGNLRLHHARRYGLILIGEGFALLAAGAFWDRGDWPALSLCAFACGMQNAMTGFYRGMMLRTTHVTGLVTDLATETGSLLRGHTVRPWRMALQCSILAGYFLGGAGGGAAFLLLERQGVRPAFTLLLPALACLTAGLLYIRWIDRRFGAYPIRDKEAFIERALRGEIPPSAPPPER